MKKIPTHWLFVLIALFPRTTHAQQDFWEPCGGPTFGNVNALALHPDGDVFAGNTAAAIHRSTDGGNTWQQVAEFGFYLLDGFARDLVLNDQGHVFAAYPAAVYRSTDKGASWVEKPIAGSLACLAINAQGQLLAGTYNKGLYRSSDNGDSWPAADIRLDSLRVLELFLSPAGAVFASTNAGLFRSADGGNTWAALPLSATVQAGAADAGGFVFAAADSSLYRSADNGASWETISWNLGWIHTLAFNSSGQLLAGSASGLFVSADQGNSWQAAGLAGRMVTALAFNAGGEWLAGTNSGVFISSDNAGSWRPASRGLGNTYPNQFAESAGGFLFTSTSGGSFGRFHAPTNGPAVYRSADEGNSWAPVFSGKHNYRAVHVTPSGHLLAEEGEHNVSGYFVQLYRSADQGLNWEYTEFWGEAQEFVNTAEGHVLAAASGYFGQHGGALGGIYKSSDNGFSWDSLYMNFDVNTFSMSQHYCLTMTEQGDIFAGISNWPDTIKIIRSTDGGQTWAPASGGIPGNLPDLHVLCLATDTGGRLFAGLSNGLLFRSENAGASWAALDLNTGGANLNDLAVDATDRIFAATANGVFYSTDHGVSWDSLNSGMGKQEVQRLYLAKNGRLFAGTAGNGAFRSAAPVSVVEEPPGAIVAADALGQVYPNPLREQARIPFSIANAGRARLAVYDMTGREVLILVDRDYTPGNYEAAFRPGGLPAGVYYYSLSTRNLRLTRKMLIVR